MASEKKTFEDLDLSQEEIKRIGEALKDEKFRKLFVEYAEELANPENRKRYEEEIAMLENERGMNVQFVNPQPGHVLKTTVDGSQKAFINVCTSDKIGKPNAKKHTNTEGKRGLYWQIPHSFSPPREELDKHKESKKCMVYDVVFHPDTYRMSDNPQFKKMVEDTALDGIEKQFECKLDRHNIRRPKLKYKGNPVSTVIRTRADDNEQNTNKKESEGILKEMPYPYGDLTSEELANNKNEELKKKDAEKLSKASKTKSNIEKKEEMGYTTPKYSIIHRSDMDIQEFRNAPDSRPSTKPKELVVSIELPLCKSATGVALDIFEDKMSLKSEIPAYKLDIKLPYQVDDELGSAKFDKTRKLLIITLPVVAGEAPKMPSFIEDTDTGSSENGNTNDVFEKFNGFTNDKPLIEELPPPADTASRDASGFPPLEDVESEPLASELGGGVRSTHMVAYAFPEFDFNQDSETVTIIFHVRNVSEDTVSKTFPEVGICRIRFASLGSGGFPMHYSFCVKFDENFQLVPEYCTVDVSDRNVSLILLKAKGNRFLWNRCMVGLDENSDLEEKLFLTENNLQLQLDQLEAESGAMGQTDEQTGQPQTKLEVTEMNSKKLTINIEKLPTLSIPEAQEEEYDADECPSSADIEVVHTKQTPPLHGILKQRSMSESSEGQGSSSSGESPTGLSPRELDGEKKGVHFNSHIDKTTYKSNMSVNSMKVALKSKRRRHHKKEEKKAAKLEKSRRRHNSTGSECSSCDEHDTKQSSESHSDDEVDDLSQQLGETGKKVSENGVIVEEEIAETLTQKDVNDIEVKEAAAEKSVESTDGIVVRKDNQPLVERPEKYSEQSEGIKTKMTRGSKLVQDVKKKLAENTEVVADDSDDDGDNDGYRTSKIDANVIQTVDENSQKVVDRTSKCDDVEGGSNDLKEKSSGNNDATTSDIHKAADNLVGVSGTSSAMIGQNPGSGEPDNPDLTSKSVNKLESGMHEKGDSVKKGENVDKSDVKKKDENGVQTEKDTSGKAEVEKNSKREDESGKKEAESRNVVETDLSWKEPNRAAPNNEHRTECAFKFSNELMFDLDID